MGEFLNTLSDTLIAYRMWAEVATRSRWGSRKRRNDCTRKHVCLLAWAFPPYVSGGVYRPTSLVKYGTDLGWKFSVIAAPIKEQLIPAGFDLQKSIPAQVEVKRIATPELLPSYSRFPRIDGGFLNALATFQTARTLLDEDPPSIIMATAPHFHNFVAAHYIAQYYKARTILDYRDEWTEDTPAFVQLGNADRQWEADCLRKADAVFFVTRPFLEKMVKAFPCLSREKCWLIPNGWEPDDFEQTGNDPQGEGPNKERNLISYVGLLGSYCSPKGFLDTLARVLEKRPDIRNRLRVRFVGRKQPAALDEISRFPHPEIVEAIDHVTKPTANRMMQESSALLMINSAPLRDALPGKLFDYLASGTPVLVFGEGGEIGRVVSELDAGTVIPDNDIDALEDALEKIGKESSARKQNHKAREWLNQHTREIMAKRMVDVFEKLTGSVR